ncbi:ABC transporter substrate-binding protein [Arthrobacter glacialis]|uniref:ABC transporter substrate-binding protein n=1 Tax=Arthrobacter glacialis TaxID=1664 RepID=UPI000CD46E70|nr:extracellular solute-binding protein [Arthrobacter glacialis]POH60283.1 ABC transporter substrate-binding protein [Arthrobacter glacialis]
MRLHTRRNWAAVASLATIALLASGCTSTDTPSADAEAGGDVTLTIATFNNFGYTDELLKEYTDANPNVTIKHQQAATAPDARTNLTTRLAAGGEGLADIEAIEIDWMPELSQLPNAFQDLASAEVEGRWLPWKEDQGRTTDGTLIGYGTDIGPQAVCYREDLVKAAGLPSDPAGFAEFLGGKDATWDDYFKAGHTFADKSDSAWFDSANAVYHSMVGQVANAYEDPKTSEPIKLADNKTIKDLFTKVLSESPDLSAGLTQWEADWDSAFQKNGFATMLCPAWMTGPIEERAGGVTGWNIADVYPGGGSNWGGSFLTVPASGKNTVEAQKLATWLTAPEQQTKAFENAGTFPSQIEAQSSQALLDSKNDFFNNAPTGQIFSARAIALNESAQIFRGPNYFAIHTAVQNGITRVDVNKSQDAEASWNGVLSEFSELGF